MNEGDQENTPFFPVNRLKSREMIRIGAPIGIYGISPDIREKMQVINTDLRDCLLKEDLEGFLIRVAMNEDSKDLIERWIIKELNGSTLTEEKKTPKIICDLVEEVYIGVKEKWDRKEFDYEPNLCLAILAITGRIAKDYIKVQGHGPQSMR